MLIHILSDFFLILIYDWGFKAWNLKNLAKTIIELLKFSSEQTPPNENLFCTKCLSKTSEDFHGNSLELLKEKRGQK